MLAVLVREPERVCDGEFGTPSVPMCVERPDGAPGSEGSVHQQCSNAPGRRRLWRRP